MNTDDDDADEAKVDTADDAGKADGSDRAASSALTRSISARIFVVSPVEADEDESEVAEADIMMG